MNDIADIVLVEDSDALVEIYSAYLRKAGMSVTGAENGDKALRLLESGKCRLLLLDLQLPDMDGMEILRKLRCEADPPAVVVVTADGSLRTAIDAMREGAYDFLVKPLTEERLVVTSRNALDHARLQRTVSSFQESQERSEYHGFIGSSLAMQAVYHSIDCVAASKASVFVTGESGTGKEICAAAIHTQSPRRNAPFVPLNCAAIPRDIMESEIFGHVKGAFTGAIRDRSGAARDADGGTLFLDEICEMDMDLQTKLLRFLQTEMVQPVGSNTQTRVDVRIICATNRDPQQEIRAGRFREDLFYRLHVVPLHIPPLRDRIEDAVEIAKVLLKRYAREEGKDFREISPEAEQAIRNHSWPGNVRELQNVLRSVVLMNQGPVLLPKMLPFADASVPPPVRPLRAEPATSIREALETGRLAGFAARPREQANGIPRTPAGFADLVGKPLWEIEREAIEATIAASGGSIPRAARILGVSPSTIYRKREAWARRENGTRPPGSA